MNDEEKLRVAYHESGHALVAYSLPNTDPVHKVSIIPRGLAALGYTMQRPEGDRFLMTQSELESRIQVLFGGTLAEEMIYNDISTGASNDLERASEIARNMLAVSASTGLLGRGAFSRFLTEALLVAVIATSLLLYPTQTVAQGITRICMQFLDVLALSLAIKANYLPRKPEA